MLVIVSLLFVCVSSPSWAVPLQQMYPWGEVVGDSFLPNDMEDEGSHRLDLSVDVIFYKKKYDHAYINANGLVSFRTDIAPFLNIPFPLDYASIAPFYTDVDTRGTGAVYYRETKEIDLLDRLEADVAQHFLLDTPFIPLSLVIVTWSGVGYFDQQTDKTNTFQLVIGNSGEDSFCEILYLDGGIQWIQSQGKSTGLPDARAQAGFVSENGQVYTLRGSGTDQILNIDKWSNIDRPGIWLFRIGETGELGNVVPPNIQSYVSEAEDTCATGATSCHSKALCIEYSPGFCCECDFGFHGNGISCLKDDEPQRVNGKITGLINGQNLTDQDFHAYIVTSDGRTYAAVSAVPTHIGYDMQPLTVLATGVAWMFSLMKPGTKNGFQLTGGKFNRSVSVSFPQTGHRLSIEQDFQGVDVFNYLRINTYFQGNIPTIPAEKQVEIDDYEQIYTKVGPGEYRSQVSLSFRLEGNQISSPFTVDETILYSPCEYAPYENEPDTMKLKVARNFIVYNGKEKTVRYAMTSKLASLSEENPCDEGRETCDEHSTCVVEGDSFNCVCNEGYGKIYLDDDGRGTCIDIDECSERSDNCHVNAYCSNLEGGFQCECHHGFTGNGVYCDKMSTCSDLQCHVNGYCTEHIPGSPQCYCNNGFTGDGYVCTPSHVITGQESCEEPCSSYAHCLYDSSVDGHVCICLPGYVGNGTYCEQTNIGENLSPEPTCTDQYCWCPEGWQLLQNSPKPQCVPGETTGPPDQIACNVLNRCHPHAQCQYNAHTGNYICVCNAGYQGDGYECVQSASCQDLDICGLHASCSYDEYSYQYVCTCEVGYSGDGYTCQAIDECNTAEDCPVNSECAYNSNTFRYECTCLPGFALDSSTCIPTQDAGCDVLQNCHPDATCQYDYYSSLHNCQCNEGFEGDGYFCQPKRTACNIVNDCGSSAECVYDDVTYGFICKCLLGFVGDGYTCSPEKTCYDTPSMCDVNAACIRIGDTYQCQCLSSYVGDGFHCEKAEVHDGNFLLLSQGISILKIPFNPTAANPGQPIVISPLQTAAGMDVDCLNGRLYWADVTGGIIRSSNYDGSDKKPLVLKDVESPEDVAVDWLAGNIYWTDSGKDTIEVMNINSGGRKLLFDDDLGNPRGIAIHPQLGKLFWTDWERTGPKIEEASLDGTNRKLLVVDKLGLPNFLTIDYQSDDLCWTDAGTKVIECINLRNNRRREISPSEYPFGITNTDDKFFWTDWVEKTVIETDKRYLGSVRKLEIPLGGSSRYYDLVAVPNACPAVSSACQHSHGGCRENELCLPTSYGGRVCSCPDNLPESVTCP